MKQKEMEKITDHFNRYFEQTDHTVLHPIADNRYHIDVLLYKPNQKYPFWKLATMGASDYKMPPFSITVSRYNEYIMFVDKQEDLNDEKILHWYYNKLLMVATFAYCNKVHITFGHSFEWKNEDPDDEMIAAFVELPQIIGDPKVLCCKLGMLKTVACLQIVLLNEADLFRLFESGRQAFSEYLYPEDGGKPHFLSERHRSEGVSCTVRLTKERS